VTFLPPQSLLRDCPPPQADKTVLADIAAAGDATEAQKQARRRAGAGYVAYVQAVHNAFDECNTQFAALRAYLNSLRKSAGQDVPQ
jgi:hypothetical protein